jgi:hypothetical protein
MRIRLALCVVAACLGGGGCWSARLSAPSGYLDLAGRNLTEEPIRWLDDAVFKEVALFHAQAAWRQVQRDAPDHPYSKDYEDGFLEGYVDYLDAGGNGEPPMVPPFRYRLTCFKNEAGVRAVEAWYAGFRQGAAGARASGQRELILVPLPGPITAPPQRHELLQPASPPPATPAQPEEPAQVLPPPRLAPGDADQQRPGQAPAGAPFPAAHPGGAP